MELVFAVLPFLFGHGLCQADCGFSSFNVGTDQQCGEMGVFNFPMTNTEGTTIVYPCDSYLHRTRARGDYCPVERCLSTGEWQAAHLSCGSSECFEGSSQAYDGRRTCTASGKMCQRWDSQTPNTHPHTDAASGFPDASLEAASNYCRDPSGDGEPWCIPDEVGGTKEVCNIPNCADVSIGAGLCAGDYCGDPPLVLESDSLCTLLVTPTYDDRRYVNAFATYACASLLEGVVSTASYCPVARCQADLYWSHVNVSCGTNECYESGQSQQYLGKRACSLEGYECQRWDVQTPHSHSHTTDTAFPDATVADAANFCRDPDGSGEPWCYTTDSSVEKQNCGIPQCSAIDVNAGNCGDAGSTEAPVSTTTPVPFGPRAVEFSHYRFTEAPHTGYEVQHTVSFIVTSVHCARICHREPGCVLLGYDASANTCTLHMENPSVTDPLDWMNELKNARDVALAHEAVDAPND